MSPTRPARKARPAPKRKTAPKLRVVKAARPGPTPARTMGELMAHAYALEVEASERYA